MVAPLLSNPIVLPSRGLSCLTTVYHRYSHQREVGDSPYVRQVITMTASLFGLNSGIGMTLSYTSPMSGFAPSMLPPDHQLRA